MKNLKNIYILFVFFRVISRSPKYVITRLRGFSQCVLKNEIQENCFYVPNRKHYTLDISFFYIPCILCNFALCKFLINAEKSKSLVTDQWSIIVD